MRDRVVMAAATIVLEPIFEADLAPASFGFRPKRSAHQAIEAVRVEANRGASWVLDADIEACFDHIDHDALMALVARRVSDRSMLKLLRSWLRAGVFEGGVVSEVDSGTPQGSPISPLLANIALHRLDEAWESGSRPGVLVRYADDVVVLCRTPQRAEGARRRAADVLAPLGLQLNPEKTRIVRLTKGAEGFDFLGFHWHKVESWRWKGRWYLQRWPSTRAMHSIRAKVRAETDRRHVGADLSTVVERLNPVLRGWATTSGTPTRPGSSVRSTPTSINASPSWPATSTPCRAGTGPAATTVRHGALRACECLTTNGVGEPCAGEPHARLDRGRGEDG